ncbi:MAG: NUDIX domain-containing protein [Nanoarchaeota archaeon]|nr:NUDIX domain-containing protein [Nanoarchaeota archaeon]
MNISTSKGINGNGNSGIINLGMLVNAIKHPRKEGVKRVVVGMMLKNNYLLEIFALYNTEKGFYELPGGKIDNDDSFPKKTLDREFAEELGMTVEIVDLLAEYNIPMKGIEKHFEVYFCKYDDLPEYPLDPKYSHHKFIPFNECHIRSDISPLINRLCEDLLREPDLVQLLRNYKKLE